MKLSHKSARRTTLRFSKETGVVHSQSLGAIVAGAFFIACIVGWYTHLLLDGCFKVFPTSQDHH